MRWGEADRGEGKRGEAGRGKAGWGKARRVLVRDWKSADAVGAMEAHLELVEALKERDVEKARAFVDKELSGVEYRLYFHDRAAAPWQG